MNRKRYDQMVDEIYNYCHRFVSHDDGSCEACLFDLTAAWSQAILCLINEHFDNDQEKVSRFLAMAESFCEMESHEIVSTAVN